MAIVLDPGGRVLLVRRAARKGDRWSSQVSLPGGMHDPADASLLDTALRETREEVGADLAAARVLGALDEVRAVANGGMRLMSIAPFVFLAPQAVPTVAGPEVAAIFWLPLDRAARGELDGRHRFPLLGLPFSFSCWTFEGHPVWGLTLGILEDLLERCGGR